MGKYLLYLEADNLASLRMVYSWSWFASLLNLFLVKKDQQSEWLSILFDWNGSAFDQSAIACDVFPTSCDVCVCVCVCLRTLANGWNLERGKTQN